MGGRGGKSGGIGGGGSADGVITSGAARTIETTAISSTWGGTRYKDTVLEATTDGKGNLTFDYATPVSRTKLAKTNKTTYVTYEVKAGAVNGQMFNVNLSKAKSVSGQTYDMRSDLKKLGFKWNGASKKWVR